MIDQTFKSLIISSFRAIGKIPNPVEHLARAGDIGKDRIYEYFRRADLGISTIPSQGLDIKTAKWLIFESCEVLGQSNQVEDFLRRKIKHETIRRQERLSCKATRFH